MSYYYIIVTMVITMMMIIITSKYIYVCIHIYIYIYIIWYVPCACVYILGALPPTPFSIFGSEERRTPPSSIFDLRLRRTKNPPPPSSIFGAENRSEDRTEEKGGSSKKGGLPDIIERVPGVFKPVIR